MLLIKRRPEAAVHRRAAELTVFMQAQSRLFVIPRDRLLAANIVFYEAEGLHQPQAFHRHIGLRGAMRKSRPCLWQRVDCFQGESGCVALVLGPKRLDKSAGRSTWDVHCIVYCRCNLT